jgi:N-methylhydantoinase A
LRVSAIGRLGKPQFAKIPQGDAVPPVVARRGTRSVIFEGSGEQVAAVFDRTKLLHGNVIIGPAIIEEVASTTVVEPGDTVTVNAFGHLIMQLGGAQ